MVRKVHAVGVIFENEHGLILVLKRHPDDPEGTTWGLVGGKIAEGEDAATAAVREVQEEVGHTTDLSKLQRLKSYHWDRDDLDIRFEVFKSSVFTDDITLTLKQDEHTEYMWKAPQELYKRKDLMVGLYPILEDTYSFGESSQR